MKTIKKSISLILCFVLVFSTFTSLGTLTLSAAGTEDTGYRYLEYGITYWYSNTGTTGYTSGTGTVDDPYIITTAAQLRHLARGDANGAGKYYKLGNDIVINDSTNKNWYEESGLQNWIKGTDANGAAVSDTMNGREMGEFLFRGNFDGAGYTISGLYIDYTGTGTMNASGTGYKRIYCGWGLFPYVYGATFKNVKLKDVYIKSNVTGDKNAEYHGYGALVGNVHGDVATTFENVQVENVHFDIARPNLSTTGKPVGVGGIIGYSTGNLTVKDAVVKNVTASFRNYYATSRCVGYAGAIFGAIGWGKTATLTNVLTFGAMNPVSVVSMTSGGAVYIASGNATGNLQENLSPVFNTTNCYSIGAEAALANSNIIKVADETTFITDNLDTFYANVGSSTNWADKATNTLPTLKSFPKKNEAVLKNNFSNYVNGYTNTSTNWTVLTDEVDGNKYLQGDFSTVTNAQDFAFTIAPNYAKGNGTITGYYGWGESGVMEPGTVYKLDFKAKAEESASMNYAIYNGYSYALNNRSDHLVDGVYDASGSRIADLTTEWQNYSMYFTAESYPNNNSQGTNRPIFQIQPNTSVFGNKIYFDDVVMTPVDAVSFKEYDNHYSQPCVGEIGAAITVPATEPKRDGYKFDGWYTDEDCTVALDTETTKIGDITVAYAKWVEAEQPILSLNFSNYINNSSNTSTNWTVGSEGNNNYLKGTTSASTQAYGFGFTLVDNSVTNYTWGVNGPLVPGTTYMVTFNAKAKNNCIIDYAVYNGYSYAKNSSDKHKYLGSNGYYIYEKTGNLASLTGEWTTFTAYFTADEFVDPDNGGVNRPVFYITNRDDAIWDNEFYFDDFEITPCEGYLSFHLYDGKYSQPCVGEIGQDITLPNNPKRTGYAFRGWYTDVDCTVALDTETTKIGDITVAYAKWEEGEEPVLNLDFSNYINGSSNTDSFWSVVTEDTNKYLKGTTSGNLNLSSFGFTLVDNSKQNYGWSDNGPLEPGKTYLITFKAKANKNCVIDYAIYNGYSYAKNSCDDHQYTDSKGITCVESTGNLASLTENWTEFYTYFTMESFVDPDNGGVNRPVFYITNRDVDVWNNEFYFDDFVITPCEGNAIGFNAYGNHFTKPYIADKDSAILLPGDPERKDYIFTGWYTNKDCTAAFNADTTKVGTVYVLYAGWTEAVTDMNVANASLSDVGNGIYAANLGTKVTNANAYAINFDINTNGNTVAVGIATASASGFGVAKNIIWQRNINANGTVSIFVKPNVIKENAVKGDTLYIFVDNSNVTVSNVKMIDAPVRNIEGDVNGDGTSNVVDLLDLKLMRNAIADEIQTWLYDLSDDGLVNNNDLVICREGLLGLDKIVKTKGDRTLVWNEEFNGTELSDKVSRLYSSDLKAYQSFDEQNIFIKDGKINLNMTKVNGVDYKVPYELGTLDKMSFKRGYLEMRAKINLSKGQWAAFWLSGLGGETNYRGEIDIFEAMPEGSSLRPNVHSWLDGERQAQLGEDYVEFYEYSADFNKTEYHTYGFEWTETELKFYVDDYCYETINISAVEGISYPGANYTRTYPFADVFNQYYYFRISNMAYSDTEEYGEYILTYDDALPEMSVDYIRLYQKTGESIDIAE